MTSRATRLAAGFLISYALFEFILAYKTRKEVQARSNSIDHRFDSSTVGGTFVNPFPEYRAQTLFEFAVARILEQVNSLYGTIWEIPDTGNEGQTIEQQLTVFKPDLDYLRAASMEMTTWMRQPKSGILELFTTELVSCRDILNFTWLGQSCLHIQLGGINFLTDPQIGMHLMGGRFGPKRLRPLPLLVRDIIYASGDRLDFVLVLHDHPDHLDLHVADQIGNSAMWIVPLGMRKRLARRGIYKVIEMDWWDSIQLNGYIKENKQQRLEDELELVCIPAMHWLGRYVVDLNKLLWCSFILRRNGQLTVYHVGDTGFCSELFEEIARRYAPVRFALVPIGQYCPSWHQKSRHIDPDEAVRISQMLGASFVQGVHWGTFKLSLEPILEPKFKFEEITKRIGMSRQYVAPSFGITYCYNLNTGESWERCGK